MFDNVLVGADGRRGGRDAIALARALASPDAKLTLVHVHSGGLRPSHAFSAGLVKAEREASEALLEQESAAAGLSAALVSFEAMSPGEGLHVLAEELGADLLVVGSCNRGAFKRVVVGDDTRAALNGAACAVAIAPAGYAEHPATLAKVGVAYNASPESEAALRVARELAKRTGASVHALHVVSLPTYGFTGLIPPVTAESIDVVLEEARAQMAALADVEGRAVYGLAGEELSAFGDQVDVLVVGSRGYGPLRRLVLGSTSSYLERHARCPLVVLPRSAAIAASDAERDAVAAAVSAQPSPIDAPPQIGPARLRDGSAVTIRPGTAKDEPALGAFLSGLGLEARRLRFFSGAVDVARAAHLSAPADGRHVGLIAHDASGAVVGHSVYVQLEPERAEVAVEVADNLHGLGLGTILIERLAVIAEQHEITHFVAEVLSENRAMLDVFRDGFDARVVRDAGPEMRVEFPTSAWRLAQERFTGGRLTGASTASPVTPWASATASSSTAE